MKNVVYDQELVVVGGVETILAIAKDNPVNTGATEVSRGCTIKNVYISVDFCGLAGSGAIQSTTVYLMKNPGDNLSFPVPRTEGTSNEKKFIFKTWNYMTMRNQDGNPPYHWEGWVKIPKRYQRFGVDDKLVMISATSTLTAHLSVMAIYKWFR